MSIVTAIWLWRRICIATRGCTSRATSSEAHALRVEMHRRHRHAGLALHRSMNARWKLRGSIGVPSLRRQHQARLVPGLACRDLTSPRPVAPMLQSAARRCPAAAAPHPSARLGLPPHQRPVDSLQLPADPRLAPPPDQRPPKQARAAHRDADPEPASARSHIERVIVGPRTTPGTPATHPRSTPSLAEPRNRHPHESGHVARHQLLPDGRGQRALQHRLRLVTRPLRRDLVAALPDSATPRLARAPHPCPAHSTGTRTEPVHPQLHVTHRQPVQPLRTQLRHDVQPACTAVARHRCRRQAGAPPPRSSPPGTGQASATLGATGPRRDASCSLSYFSWTISRVFPETYLRCRRPSGS